MNIAHLKTLLDTVQTDQAYMADIISLRGVYQQVLNIYTTVNHFYFNTHANKTETQTKIHSFVGDKY